MPIRDLSVLFKLVDRVSQVFNPIVDKMNEIDGSEVTVGLTADARDAITQTLEFQESLDGLANSSDQAANAVDKTTNAAKKEADKAGEAAKKTKEAGEAAKAGGSYFDRFSSSLSGASDKLTRLADRLDGVKNKLLAAQAVVTGFATAALLSASKTESLIDEIQDLRGMEVAKPLVEWAEKGNDIDWTNRSQRLTIATDLSDLDYGVEETKKYGEEIEKAFFQSSGKMKRYGIQSASELAQALASAEKTGNTRSIERMFSAGAISEEKLAKETDRLRMNYEKFAFATDEVVKKQAMHNLIMKELVKTNANFTGSANTLDEKLDVLQKRFGSLLNDVGQKLEPVAKKVVDALILVIDKIEEVPYHEEIIIFIGILVTAIAGLVAAILGLAPIIAGISWLLGAGGVGAALAGLVGTISSVLGGLAALVAGFLAIPGLPVVAAILAIITALILVYEKTTIIQDGFEKIRPFVDRARESIKRLKDAISDAFKGGKTDIGEIKATVADFLDGLIPGWLSGLWTKGENLYRDVMKWLSGVLGWWNDLLKKIGETSDKIKGILGLGTEEQKEPIQPGAAPVSKGYTRTYQDANGQWMTEEYARQNVPKEDWGKLTAKGQFSARDIRSYMEQGRLLGTPEETDGLGKYSPSEIAKDTGDAVGEKVEEAKEAIIQNNQDYVDKAATTYEETKNKTGSTSAAAMAAWDPIGYYVGGAKKLFGVGDEEGGSSQEPVPQGAVGATVNKEGLMIVHSNEEVVPAKITQGAGKLASLLEVAYNYVNGGQSEIEREYRERVSTQSIQQTKDSRKADNVNVYLTIDAPVTVEISRDVDIRKLDVNRLIDWSQASYQLEKIVKELFRMQEG